MNRNTTYEMLLHHSAPFECIPVLHDWNDLPSKFAMLPARAAGEPSAVLDSERERTSRFAAALARWMRCSAGICRYWVALEAAATGSRTCASSSPPYEIE